MLKEIKQMQSEMEARHKKEIEEFTSKRDAQKLAESKRSELDKVPPMQIDTIKF